MLSTRPFCRNSSRKETTLDRLYSGQRLGDRPRFRCHFEEGKHLIQKHADIGAVQVEGPEIRSQ